MVWLKTLSMVWHQAGNKEVPLSQKETRIHYRGGECEEACSQAVHSGQWVSYDRYQPAAGRCEPHNPGAMAQQKGEEAGHRNGHAGAGFN